MADKEEVMISKFVMRLVRTDIAGFWIVCHYNKASETETNVINKMISRIF